MESNFSNQDEQRSLLIIRMARLIAKEQLGELSDLEQEELNHWLAAEKENQVWKEQLSNTEYLSEMLENYRSYEASVETSLQSFHSKYMDDLPVVPLGRKVQMNRWRAVAAVLVPLIVIGIWMTTRHSKPAIVATPLKADVRPGRDVATLTLANGNHILLDTGVSGQLVQNGGVKVDYKQGQVNYQEGHSPGKEVTYNTLTTAKGGQYQLRLPDGTKVWLNAASSLRYPTVFSGDHRHVELTGEAYFEVAQKKDQPFSVEVDGMNVQVLGTEFDIMAYAEEGDKRTTLVQGAVKILSGKETRELKVGEQAIVSTGGVLSVDPQADVESVIAWKLGFFQFGNMDLKTIMRQIARWYDVDIVYRREDLSGKYGGSISRKLNLSELIGLLEGNGDGHFKIEGRKLIVLP